jgi:mutator protein MutT
MLRNISLLLLFDEKKRILLQHRTDDAPRLAGYWAFFGGGIEKGETPEDAVKREIMEELEYELVNPNLVMVQDFETAGINGKKYVFMEKYDYKKKLVLKEGQGMNWYYLQSALDLKMTEDDKEIIRFIEGKY